LQNKLNTLKRMLKMNRITQICCCASLVFAGASSFGAGNIIAFVPHASTVNVTAYTCPEEFPITNASGEFYIKSIYKRPIILIAYEKDSYGKLKNILEQKCEPADPHATTDFKFTGNYPSGSWFCKVPGIRMEQKRSDTSGDSTPGEPYFNNKTIGRVSYAATEAQARTQLLANFNETNPDYKNLKTVMNEDYYQGVECLQLK